MENEVISGENRDRAIVRASVLGIVANVLLSAFKAAVGLATNSIAIALDAVNNLSDAAASIVTVVGTKLARRRPDRKHPFAYGRIEYLSALVISLLVLYAGVASFSESVKKIVEPETPDYGASALVIVAAAVLAKIALGIHVKRVGKRVDSDALVNSGEDARLDAVISASTLAAAVLFMATGLSLEAWLGALISLVIVKSGVGMVRDTVSRLLGEGAGVDLAREVKATVASFEGVAGAYDLVLNDYGPGAFLGSIHVEVPGDWSAARIDELTREIVETVHERHRVILAGVSVYAIDAGDVEAVRMRDKVRELALGHEHVRGVHGFHADVAAKKARFDLVVSFDAPDRDRVRDEVLAEVREAFPGYEFDDVVVDADFNEL